MDRMIEGQDQGAQAASFQIDTMLRFKSVANFAAAGVGERSNLSGLLQLMGAEMSDVHLVADTPVPLRSLRAGEVLFHEGERAEAIYFVRVGTFKTFHTGADGYEQVLSFVGRAEVLGFDAVGLQRHPTAAVALENSSVYVVLMRDMFALSQHISAFGRVLHLATGCALAHSSELADMMAAVAAEVRLARFLVQLSKRMAACGQSPRRFHLRMSRRDIASYLGVAHETVSRSFSALVNWGYLQVNIREVEILKMDALKVFACSTRRPADEIGRSHDAFLHLTRPPVGHRELYNASL